MKPWTLYVILQLCPILFVQGYTLFMEIWFCIKTFSISLLECLPARPHTHLLNNASPKPVCLFTTWLGKELSSAKITLPDFSFKLTIDQGRKLKHIKAENICSEKNSLTILLPSVSVSCADWLPCLGLDPTMDARIDRKSVFTKFVLLKPWSQQNPLLFLKIQASNEIIWFEMHRTDQRTPRQLSLLNVLHVSLSWKRPITFYVSLPIISN